MTTYPSKKILLYCSFNQRSVHIESIASEVNKSGHDVIVLTTCERGALHEELEKLGIKTYTKTFKRRVGTFYFLKHIYFLISFCKKYKVNTLWSHLQDCNLIAVFAQYFIKARVVTFRHHFHAVIKTEGFKAVNKNELRVGKIVSRLAKEIVVPCTEVFEGMVQYEKVPARKISIVPYIYNFNLYGQPNEKSVKEIKEKYPARLLLVTASRMIKMKRHILVLPIYKSLIERGFDIKVLLLDKGEEMDTLKEYVTANNLQGKIFFLGFQPDIINYLAATDLLVHPSYTEASSSLVKELGLVRKPVIVCKGVGDFDEYIVQGKNGFIVSPPDEALQFEKYIITIYDNPSYGIELGNALHDTVINIFAANPMTVKRYLEKA